MEPVQGSMLVNATLLTWRGRFPRSLGDVCKVSLCQQPTHCQGCAHPFLSLWQVKIFRFEIILYNSVSSDLRSRPHERCPSLARDRFSCQGNPSPEYICDRYYLPWSMSSLKKEFCLSLSLQQRKDIFGWINCQKTELPCQ